MKKMGNRFGKKIALSVVAFGFVAASALVSAQEHISRECNDQTKLSACVHANIVKNQSDLHEKLNLTEQQEPAWQGFVESIPSPSKPFRPDRLMEKLTTPERMAQQLAALREQETKMMANLLALKTFYAALTPDQQKEFDDYHAKMGRNAHLKPDIS